MGRPRAEVPTNTVAGQVETGGVVGSGSGVGVGVGEGEGDSTGVGVTSAALAELTGVATRPNPIATDAMAVVTGSADNAEGM